MIPREILKKIRQIEIRTNRVVTETLCPRLLKSAAESFRIPAGMINRDDTDFIAFNREVNPIFESRHSCLADNSGFFLEKFRVLFDALKQRQKFGVEFPTQSRLPFFIPFQRLKVIQVSGRFEPHPLHFQPKRLRASSRTCSNGIPSRGFSRNSSARRSSSAFCSGVSSSLKSPNSKSMVSTSSRRSASGIRRSSSRISVLLMAAIYSFDLSAQAGFSASRITHHASRHP